MKIRITLDFVVNDEDVLLAEARKRCQEQHNINFDEHYEGTTGSALVAKAALEAVILSNPDKSYDDFGVELSEFEAEVL